MLILRSRIAQRGALALAVQLASDPTALAHHSFAMFDRTKTIAIEGTVRTFQWSNPHSYVWVYANQTGAPPVLWALEFSGGSIALSHRGWNRNTLRPGERVAIAFNPLRDGRKGGEFISAKLPDGSTLVEDNGNSLVPDNGGTLGR